MRLTWSRRLGAWAVLASFLTLSHADQGTPANVDVVFLAELENGAHILDPSSQTIFTFTASESIQVTGVALCSGTSVIASAASTTPTMSDTKVTSITTTAPTTTTTSTTSASSSPNTPAATQSGMAALTTYSHANMARSVPPIGGNMRQARAESTDGYFTFSMTNNTGTIYVSSVWALTNLSSEALYFQVAWTLQVDDSSRHGVSNSRKFAFQQGGSDPQGTLYSLVLATTPAYPETTYATSATNTKASATTKTAASSTSATSGAPSDSGAAGNSTVSATSKSKKSNGLSGGAIAGIVIGIVAAVLIIAGALLCYMRLLIRPPYRRRPGSEQMGLQIGYVSAPAGEKDGMVDGNGSGPRFGNSIILGGHSPYSDDDGAGGVGAASAAAAADAAATAGQARTIDPSSPATTARAVDLPSPTLSAVTATAPSVSVGAAAPAPASALASASPAAPAVVTPMPIVSGQVAALIEDDMTPEDVARLAAEEQEIDAAIENDMRKRGQA